MPPSSFQDGGQAGRDETTREGFRSKLMVLLVTTAFELGRARLSFRFAVCMRINAYSQYAFALPEMCQINIAIDCLKMQRLFLWHYGAGLMELLGF